MPSRHQPGFTFIEIVLVAAVLLLVAVLAFPALRDMALKKQVKEGMALAELAKSGVQQAYSLSGEMPADNAKAGIPEPAKIVGNFVSAVTVADGAVTLTFGNNAGGGLAGRKLTLRPAVVPSERVVPIAWLCHEVRVPGGMERKGRNETDIPPPWLPIECRGGEAK
jgi:type IV pilus assembly protein PilA